jgi:hypothetical protein
LGAAIFHSKSREVDPLRQLVYVSDLKLQGLAEQIPAPVAQKISAELKLDLKVVSLTLSGAPGEKPSRDGRAAKLTLVEERMRRSGQIGDLDAESGYFTAELDMDWLPLGDGETILFCGYSGSLLLVLGGSVSHLLGQPLAEKLVGSQPYTIRAAIHGSGAPRPEDLGRDLFSAARIVYVTPQPVRLLASVITRGPLPRGSSMKSYLLGTPVFVEAAGKNREPSEP